ncbi:MAG: FtsQ-type POTRA domain-containing protein, partial [Nitrospirota bacterium]
MRSKPKIKKGRAGAARGFIPKLLVIAAGAALVAGVPFAAGAAYRYVSKLPMFEIRQVKVTGLDFVRKEDFVRYIGDPRGLSFLRYSISDAQKKADEHPWVKSSIVRREAPDTVRFEVVERIPAAVVNTAAGRYVIDSDGYVVAKINDPAWDFL